MLYRKTLIAAAAAVALGCLPVATTASAAGHGQATGGHAMGGQTMGGRAMGGQAMGGQAMRGQTMRGQPMNGYARNGYGVRYGGRSGIGSIYDSCPGYGAGYGYGYNGCPGYGDAPLVTGVIGGILGGYGPY